MKKMLFLILSIITINNTFGMDRIPPKKRKPYACQQCSKQFYTPEDCTTHSNQHYRCFICPNKPRFLNQATLTEHIRKNRIHDQIATDNMATVCSDCAITFSNPKEKLYHLAQQHSFRPKRRRSTRSNIQMRNAIELLNKKVNAEVTLLLSKEDEEKYQIPQSRKKPKRAKKRQVRIKKTHRRTDFQLPPENMPRVCLAPATPKVLTESQIAETFWFIDSDDDNYSSIDL